MMNDIHLQPVSIEQVSISKSCTVDILRLDRIHSVISGNKWYKLNGYIREAKEKNKEVLLTYGGAYSNHIIATAAATAASGLKSIGIIRGEKPAVLSHTLKDALSYGMELFFISRDDYKNKILPGELFSNYKKEDLFVVNEGGYGITGAMGASRILEEIDSSSYTHIVVAVGTGTMLAGLVMAASSGQLVIGISVLKNNSDLQEQIELLLPTGKKKFLLLHDFHFGGYAKYNNALIDFMNEWYRRNAIPSDFVYTGKLFYATDQLIQTNFFSPGSKVLVIHSGGLQGNLSLPKGKLIF